MNSKNPTNPYTGIDKSWQILKESNPQNIAENTLTEFILQKNIFIVKYLNENYAIDLNTKTIYNLKNNIKVTSFDFNLSILIYMTTMDAEMPADKFISASENPSVTQFFSKNHVIPADKLTKSFDNNFEFYQDFSSQSNPKRKPKPNQQ